MLFILRKVLLSPATDVHILVLVLLADEVLHWQGSYLGVRVSSLDGDVQLHQCFAETDFKFQNQDVELLGLGRSKDCLIECFVSMERVLDQSEVREEIVQLGYGWNYFALAVERS